MAKSSNNRININFNVPELIADMWAPLTVEQQAYLSSQFILQSYKKNEVIHYEGETPTHMMCLLSGKVKIFKEGVGGRSQIIRPPSLRTPTWPMTTTSW